eukprot:4740194-Pleurochrysis_carterae.AAC.1
MHTVILLTGRRAGSVACACASANGCVSWSTRTAMEGEVLSGSRSVAQAQHALPGTLESEGEKEDKRLTHATSPHARGIRRARVRRVVSCVTCDTSINWPTSTSLRAEPTWNACKANGPSGCAIGRLIFGRVFTQRTSSI